VLTVVPDDCPDQPGASGGSSSLIDEIVGEDARRMLAEALQAEVDAYIAAFAAERDENGRRLVVRNGYHQGREVLTSAGAVEVTAPRVNAPHLVALVRAGRTSNAASWSSAPRRPRHD
jgi:transposase-like protein